MQRRFMWVSLAAILGGLAIAGCQPENLDPQDFPPGAQEGPLQTPLANGVLQITAPAQDVSVAIGQPVEIRWTISDLPNDPTIDLFYQATGEGVELPIVADLGTNAQGTFDFDTSVLTIGLKYTIVVKLKSAGQIVETATSEGTITVAAPSIAVTAPANDLTLVPSDTAQVDWTGQFLPAGGKLEVFLDFDFDFDSGNELAVTSDPITDPQPTQSGTVSIPAADLLNVNGIQRGVFYYLGVRVVKDTVIVSAAYADGSVRLYDGDRFEVLEPADELAILVGNEVAVLWNPSGVPEALTVTVQFVEREQEEQQAITPQANGDEETVITAVTGVPVNTGRAVAVTNELLPEREYDVRVLLMDGNEVVDTEMAPGTIVVVGWGTTIGIIDMDLSEDSDSKKFVGIGCSIDIKWEIEWGAGPTQENSKVKLYLDQDGIFTTTEDQLEITPEGGIDPELGTYTFTPDRDTHGDRTQKDYYVFAEVDMTGPNALDRSDALLHVAEDCLTLTQPAADIERALGEQVTIAWTLAGDSCTQSVDVEKTLKLYIDTVPEYRPGQAREVTPQDTNIYPCSTSQFTFSIDGTFVFGENYYVIGRLLLDGQEDFRATALGRISIPQPSFTVLKPFDDVTTGYAAIPIEWSLAGIPSTGRFVRTFAVPREGQPGEGMELVISSDFPAADLAGVADASKLPPGRYDVRCALMTRDGQGVEMVLMKDDAPAGIIFPGGYDGIYDLGDMEAGFDIGYSPIDGVIFEGYNISDRVGFQVAGVGDLDVDGYGDFLVFSRYGQEYTVGNAGSAYLIYGAEKISQGDPFDTLNIGRVPLNRILGDTPIRGSILLFPMENLAIDEGGSEPTGAYTAMGLPDVSLDGKGELMIGAPDVAPLKFQYEFVEDDIIVRNFTAAADSLVDELLFLPLRIDPFPIVDHYGLTREIPLGLSQYAEPSHVYPWFSIAVPHNSPAYTPTLGDVLFEFGADDTLNQFLPGDTIRITVHERREAIMTYDANGNIVIEYKISWITNVTTTEDASQDMIGSPDPYIERPASIPHHGATYLVTSDRLLTYQNQAYDLAKIGSPAEDFQGAPDPQVNYDLGFAFGANPERTQMLTTPSPGGFFGSALSVVPSFISDDSLEMIITSRTQGLFDMADPDRPPRAGAGLAYILDADIRYTSIPGQRGRIAWSPSATQMEFQGDGSDVDGPLVFVDVYGPAANANLTSVEGLGRFTTLNDYSAENYTEGDFNGDSIPDLLIGSPGVQDGGNTVGAVYVVMVRPITGRRLAVLDLEDFNRATPPGNDPALEVPVLGVKILGTTTEQLGQLSGGAGDFNGDGLSDFFISLPNVNGDTGKVIVVFGTEDLLGDFALSDVSSAEGAQVKALIFEGEAAGNHFGQQVSAVYDVNGDGYDDLLVAAPDADTATKTDCGKVYLIYGRDNIIRTNPANDFTFVDYDKDGNPDNAWPIANVGVGLPGAVFIGANAGDRLQAVSRAADANGDAVGDFIIGAPFADVSTVQQNAGKAYLILGRSLSIE